MANASDANRPSLAARLWIYQAERFPIFKHGLLIAAFGASGVCVSALLRGSQARPDPAAIAVSIGVLFLLFFQLRVADEHKDAEDDRRYRPERPVPRGLVSLMELRALAFVAAGAQALLVLWFHPPLFLALALVWAWMVLMTAEFFAPAWLKARPIVYMVSHMVIMPLIDLFATACDWMPSGEPQNKDFTIGLGAFLVLSFFNGTALEIGRKTWAPEDEREGVETYSKLWGSARAGFAAACAILAALLASLITHYSTDAPIWFAMALAAGALFAVYAARTYVRAPTHAHARALENSAGVWVLVSYVALGIAPMIARMWFA
jgi:4-hydroxybenzoate polyprenyltransferase